MALSIYFFCLFLSFWNNSIIKLSLWWDEREYAGMRVKVYFHSCDGWRPSCTREPSTLPWSSFDPVKRLNVTTLQNVTIFTMLQLHPAVMNLWGQITINLSDFCNMTRRVFHLPSWSLTSSRLLIALVRFLVSRPSASSMSYSNITFAPSHNITLSKKQYTDTVH